MSTRVDVAVVNDEAATDDVDLEIAGSPDVDPETVKLVVGVNGTYSRLEVSYGELTKDILDLAVAAALREQPELSWFETLLEAGERLDHILEEAVAAAAATYDAGGGIADWAEAFRAGRTDFGGRPMSGASALSSVLAAEPGIAIPADSAPARMVQDYELTPRQVDVLLACLFNELDARFAQRYAYLVGDSLGPGPDGRRARRAAVHRWQGSAVPDLRPGVGRAGGRRPDPPDTRRARRSGTRSSPSTTRCAGSSSADESPDEADTILDPELTPRVSDRWAPPMGGPSRRCSPRSGRGGLVHIHGGVDADRRSRALDVARAAGSRLLVVPWARFSELDLLGAHRLRRHCLRLNVLCLVEGVPRDADPDLLGLAISARVALTSGPDALPPGGPVRLSTTPSGRRPSPSAGSSGSPPRTRRDRRQLTASRRSSCGSASASTGPRTPWSRPAPRTRASPARTWQPSCRSRPDDDAGGLLQPLKPRARFDDLVLTAETRRGLEEAKDRIVFRDVVTGRLGWDRMTDRQTGTYLLFAGPAGTGKTLAAEALANELGLPVQLLEISALFSRWVGDFEERVDRVFQAAQSGGALLVVNEADAILGPRTQVVHAQDRYANAGTAHILSRLEQFTGPRRVHHKPARGQQHRPGLPPADHRGRALPPAGSPAARGAVAVGLADPDPGRSRGGDRASTGRARTPTSAISRAITP